MGLEIEINDRGVLLCPGCKDEYLHQGRVESYSVRQRIDPTIGLLVITEAGEMTVDSVLGSNDDRGDLSVGFYCECCDCEPVLRIENLKGHTYISWDNRSNSIEGPESGE